MNELLISHREEIVQKLVELARQIHFGRNPNCFIVGNCLISLMAGPITDLETLDGTVNSETKKLVD